MKNEWMDNEYARRNEHYAVMVGMRIFGGGFVEALADLIDVADEVNMRKIKETWPDEWAKYYEFGLEELRRKRS